MDTALSTLKNNPLFAEFSAADFELLAPCLSIQRFKPFEWVFREGEKGKKFYLIQEGKVEALKELGKGFVAEPIGTFGPDEWFGEMAYLEEGRRSASIRVIEPTIAIAVEFEKANSKIQEIESKISRALLKKISSRLRKTDEILVDSVRKKLEITLTASQISEVLIYTFILISIVLISEKIVETYLQTYENLIILFLHPVFLILIGMATLFVIKKSPYSWSFYGITSANWKKNIWEGVYYTIPICAFLIFIKWMLIFSFSRFADLPLFDINYSQRGLKLYIFENAAYLLLVPLQELIVRGLLQNGFRNFFQGENKVFRAILTSNLIFLILHTTISPLFAFGTFIFGIFWGLLYERQKSLVGVTVSHTLIGWEIFFLLNYYSLDL